MERALPRGDPDGPRCYLLPFSFILYQADPKTRSGQKVPWALGGNLPHFLYSSQCIRIRWYAARCQCAQICIVSNIMTLCPPTWWSRLIHLFEYRFTKSGTKYTHRTLKLILLFREYVQIAKSVFFIVSHHFC